MLRANICSLLLAFVCCTPAWADEAFPAHRIAGNTSYVGSNYFGSKALATYLITVLYTDSRWKPCKVDRVLDDGDEVKLGDVTLVAHLTPGHTRGCTTWTWKVADGGRTYDVVVIGSPNVNPGYRLVGNQDYPKIADDFAKTFDVLNELPCDIFLGAHGDYYDMLDKYERVKAADANPFVDPAGYRAYVEQKELAFRKTLSDQSAK